MSEPDTIDVTEDLVRALLREQHPDLAELPLVLVGTGWDNRVWRVGGDLTVRLPVRAQAAPLIDHELRWLPTLVACLPKPDAGGLSTSAPLRTGEPGRGYPFRWTIGPWLPGRTWAEVGVDDPVAAAARLGRFLAAFHRPAPADAPLNPYRGVPLAERVPMLRDHLVTLVDRGRPLPPAIRGVQVLDRLRDLAATPRWDGPPLWLHGDPHPMNLVVDGGRLTGIIDFGDLTSGDPASDLAARWMVVPPEARHAFVAEFDIDDATWRRAEGWALALAVGYQAGSPDGSPLIELGRRRLVELMA